MRQVKTNAQYNDMYVGSDDAGSIRVLYMGSLKLQSKIRSTSVISPRRSSFTVCTILMFTIVCLLLFYSNFSLFCRSAECNGLSSQPNKEV